MVEFLRKFESHGIKIALELTRFLLPNLSIYCNIVLGWGPL